MRSNCRQPAENPAVILIIWNVASVQWSVVVTISQEQWYNLVLIPLLDECIRKLTLDPHGFDGSGRQNHQEPITLLQGSADLLLPLLRPSKMCSAVPNRDTMFSQQLSNLICRSTIARRVRKENSFGKPQLTVQVFAGANSNPCLI